MNATLKTAARGTGTNLDTVKAVTAKVSHAKTKATPARELPSISSVKLVPLNLIDILPQVRTIFDEDSLHELAEDIQARGLLQPVLLNPHGDRFTLIAGERRYRACNLAGLSDIPALITKASSADALLMQLAENVQREDLELQDEVNAIRLLHDNLKTVQAVADTVKKSKAWVSKRLALSHPNFAWAATSLMEDGITEDVEILNCLSTLAGISYTAGEKLTAAIRAGTATRETARQMLKDIKKPAQAEHELKQRQTCFEAREQARAEREANAAKRTQGTGPEFIESAMGKLQMLCAEPDDLADPSANNATAYLNSVSEPQRAALLAYLQTFQDDAKTWTLGRWAQILTPYDSPATYIEQFVAVMAIKGKGERLDNLYALVTILEQANRELEP